MAGNLSPSAGDHHHDPVIGCSQRQSVKLTVPLIVVVMALAAAVNFPRRNKMVACSNTKTSDSLCKSR
jgi:hypothetical protein